MREVICNNCVGGEVYRALNLPYDNPFIWCDVDSQTFSQIVENFAAIDFSNVKQVSATASPLYASWAKNGQNVSDRLCLLLDDKYVMLFPHHIASAEEFVHISARFKRYQPRNPIFVLHATAAMCKDDVERFLALGDACYVISQFEGVVHERHLRQSAAALTVPAIAKFALDVGLRNVLAQ